MQTEILETPVTVGPNSDWTVLEHLGEIWNAIVGLEHRVASFEAKGEAVLLEMKESNVLMTKLSDLREHISQTIETLNNQATENFAKAVASTVASVSAEKIAESLSKHILVTRSATRNDDPKNVLIVRTATR